ncbi:MAG: ATP-binding protein [Candidatus Hodarchaeales archaeon]
MIEDVEIIQYLQQSNPWWMTGRVPSSLLVDFHTREFYTIIKEIDSPLILSLTGLRRVGKTTLLRQLIDYLLRSLKVPSKNILFLTLDDPIWTSTEISIKRIMDLYIESILGVTIDDLSKEDRIYFFIDEIQYFSDWERHIKVLYDRNLNIKFIISGSSSIHLYSKSAESLVGRVYIQKIFPFKFTEVCRFKYRNNGKIRQSEKISSFNFAFREHIVQSIRNQSLSQLMEFLEKEKVYWLEHQQQWLIYLNDYLVKGGLPELFQYDLVQGRQYIQTYTDLILYRDIRQKYSIRNVEKFRKLFFWIIKESSQRTNTRNLSVNIGIKYETLQQYLEALETSLLIRRIPFYSKSASKQIRKPSKLFVTDIGIQAAYLNYPLEIKDYSPQILGKVVETLVCDHLVHLKFSLEHGMTQPLYYWMHSNSNVEVDFVLELFNTPIPIEVKYQTQLTASDLIGVKKFLSNHKDSPFGIVISKKHYECQFDSKILVLPLELFLLVS